MALVMTPSRKDQGVFTFADLDRTLGDEAVILTNGDDSGALMIPILKRFGASPAFIAVLKVQCIE
jgi:hypothetical protein